MTLRRKLLISYVIIGLLPLLAIGAYARVALRHEKLRSLSDFFLAQLRQIDFTLTSFLADVEADVEGLANNPVAQVRDAGAFTNFIAADETTFAYAIGDAEQRIIDLFVNYQTYHEYANSVYMGRDNGAFVRSYPRARPTPYDPRERPWYRLALSQPHRVMRTAPYKSVTTDDVNVGIVKALTDAAGDVFGVIGVDITLHNLTTVVSQIQTGMHGHVVLLDADGMLLTNPMPERHFRHYAEVGLDAFADVMAFERGQVRFRDQGLGWYAFFWTSPESGWKICAVVPESEVEREIAALLRIVLVFLALTLAAGVMYAYALARHVTAPLDGLIAGIRRLGDQMKARQAFERLPIPANHEIAAVVATLNAMGADLCAAHEELRQYNENLEQIVAERTQQISETNARLRREIADRERAQAELWTLSRAVEHSANSILMTDLSGRIEFVNPAFTAITGYTAAETLGRNPRILKSGRMAPEVYADLWNTVQRGEVWKGELLNRRKDGRLYWEFSTISPVKNAAGAVTHYLAVKEDITARKQMEDALRQATETALDARLAAEEAREAADIARHEAEAANQAKSQFLANMSHELRTPLNGILGYAQILKMQRRLTEFQQKGIDIIERSGRHLLNLINDVLDLSKIEARKIEITPLPVFFVPFLRDITEMIRVQAEHKGLEVRLELAPDLPPVARIDEQRLSQILLNLLGNAVKFTARGTVGLRVVGFGNSATHHLHFEISDTGLGIAPDHLETIFSVFTQVGTQPRTIEGTGLGLAISRELVRLMGGELQVRSAVGAGSTFWFRLPLVAADARDVLQGSERWPIVGFTSGTGATPKILVVDDKLENRALLTSLLLSVGFEVQEACDGQEGEACALEFRPDLIFMDLIMPVMDGFEATRRLRRAPEFAALKIIAVSASTLISAAHLRAEFGFDDYVPKPLQIHEVFEKLTQHLNVEWRYEDAAPPAATAAPAEPEIRHVPPRDTLARLSALARDGNFTALRADLDRLETNDPRDCAFARHVRDLAATLNEDAICQFLGGTR